MEAVEFAEALALDALNGDAPTVYAVLTTRTATHDTERFYRSREQVQRAVRRRWPASEFCWVVEFTTGRGPRSGGVRRPHWNALIKGVPVGSIEEAAAVIRSVWCAREDAEPQAQYVGAVEHVGGLMRYLGLHFFKVSQRPPKGWRGHRTTVTRGYFGRPMREVRDEARRSLQEKRALWRALRDGYEGEEAELVAAIETHNAARAEWEPVVISEKVLPATGEVVPRVRPLGGGEVTVLRRPRGRDFRADAHVAAAQRALDGLVEDADGVQATSAEPPPQQDTTEQMRFLELPLAKPRDMG